MRGLLTAGLLLSAIIPGVKAAVFTVKPGTQFYSKPQAKEELLLELPEVRVHVPPSKDASGFCLFKLIYKIADRDNPLLPATGWARCVSTDSLVPD